MNEQITLYTTHCPKCIILGKKLDQKNIKYSEVTDTTEIMAAGFLSVPVLKVDDKYYEFTDAVKWVNERN